MKTNKPFLTGSWTDLMLLVYEIEPKYLNPFLPKDLVLHLFNGKAYVSIVAFTFTNAKFYGIQMPNHKQFGQVNLRTYVKHKETGEVGVQFLKEMCPKFSICLAGKYLYHEPFQKKKVKRNKTDETLSYRLNSNQKEFQFSLNPTQKIIPIETGSLADYIVNNHISFSHFPNGKGKPFYIKKEKPWQTYRYSKEEIPENVHEIFKAPIRDFMKAKPIALFYVNGSNIEVYNRKFKTI